MAETWGVFLCHCRGTLALDPQKLVWPVAPSVLSIASDPGAAGGFTAGIERERPDRILIACCAETELFANALGAASAQTAQAHFLDLKHLCFSVHRDLEMAHAKATRLLRLAMAGAQRSDTPAFQPLTVGRRILVAGDLPAVRRLAKKLPAGSRPIFVLPLQDPPPAEVDGAEIVFGQVIEVAGRLGDFRATVETILDGNTIRRQINADQIVVISRATSSLARPRTGCHFLSDPNEHELLRISEKIGNLQGDFLKPVQVNYSSDICAGGSAGREACGICIPACPYEAIARDPENRLRIRVDQMACEGCGACVSACPTSALRFSDPSPDELYAKMAALLRPLPGSDSQEALVLLFHCSETGRRALEDAGRASVEYPATVLPLEVPCLRYVSEASMLAAFALGAAGVGLLGCESCPHGERELLHHKLDFARLTLDAFGLGAERLRLMTTNGGAEAPPALAAFANSLSPTPISWGGGLLGQRDNRELIAGAIKIFMDQLGLEPGRRALAPSQPFGFAEVKDAGCTLCRSCVNVCPVHAFKLDEASQSLQFRHLSCVGCGLCEQACPEHVIALRREIYFDRSALEYLTVARDDMVACSACAKPFINRRALEIIESRVLSLDTLLDTFSGDRRNLLRMCPDCRTVAAMLEVDKGWKP